MLSAVGWFRGLSAGAALALLLAGCSTLPNSGPLTAEVLSEESYVADESAFLIIDVDERVSSIWASQPRDTLRVFSDNRPPPDSRIGVGDTVVVTIYEAAAGGLFSASAADRSITAGSRTAVIPEQVVPQDGTIQVPYAGRIRVRGLRPAEVEQLIVDRLRGKAIEPQAVVSISKNISNVVTITGEVTNGARIPLTVRGDRLLDVIASAGGLRSPAHESFVRLTRNKQTVSVAFNAILQDPNENIYVRPDDVVTVVRMPQTFTAFGSTGRNATIPFEAVGISLEEAVAKSGGLVESLADPAGVFLLRFENAALAQQLAPDRVLPSQGNLVPVVYRFDLRSTRAYFLARAFQIRDKDMLYVAAASSVPVRKFLGMIGQVVAPAVQITRVAQ